MSYFKFFKHFLSKIIELRLIENAFRLEHDKIITHSFSNWIAP